mmetsp:Transcript_40408/g.79073  ORF Transcript_40408/g.79073 Transcript_40408/m.79073 type:complete len:438 (+) Transcript_40408:81-1394(+)
MHNFAGPLVDFGNSRVPPVPLRRHLRDVPHPPQHLHRLVRTHGRGLARRQLRHGRLLGEGFIRVLQHGCPPVQEPRRVGGQGHPRELDLYRLQVGDGRSERLPFERVRRRAVDGRLCDAQRLSRHADSSSVECDHCDLEPLALLAEELVGGDFHVLHDEVCGGRRPYADLVLLRPEGKSRRVRGHDERRDALVFFRFVRGGEHHRRRGLVRVRDPGLGPVEDIPPVAVGLRGGARGARVASVSRLAQSETSDLLPGRVGRQPLLLLRCRPELVDRGAVQAVMGAHDDTHGRAAAGHLLHGQGVGEGVHARPSVLVRDREAHETEVSQLRDRIRRKLVPGVPPPGVWGQLLVGELAAHVADHLVLLRQAVEGRVRAARGRNRCSGGAGGGSGDDGGGDPAPDGVSCVCEHGRLSVHSVFFVRVYLLLSAVESRRRNTV